MSEITVPYLQEHQSAENPNGGLPGYNPSEDEKKILRLVDNLYSKAKKYRKRYDARWIDWYKMYRGRQWKEVRPSYRSSEVLNLIFDTIESQVPILTDSRPKVEFMSTLPQQTELADILNKVLENDWEHNNWDLTLVEVLKDGKIYCSGLAYVGFNSKANMGLGSIEFESSDSFYEFPDPNARDVNGKRTKYWIEAIPTDIVELKKEYPDKAQFIAADIIDFSQADKADIYQVMFKSPTDSKLIIEGPSGYDTIAKNQALKITLYSKDDDFEEEEKIELNDDGTPKLDENNEPKKKFIQKLKYPNGRKIVVAGGVLLDDGEFDFEDGLFPYAKYTNYILPREFWGMGEVEQLDNPQKSINKILAHILDTMALMSNPIWKVGSPANIDTDNLFNKPGLVVEADDVTQIVREPGVDLPPFVMALLDRYKQFFGSISGSTDLSKGVEPTDVTANSAIQSLQQAAQTRLRLQARNLEAFLVEFGKLYLSRVFQFYSVPRLIRVSGNPNAEKYFYFHVEKLESQDENGNPITKRIAHINENGQAKQIEIIADFDVRVSMTSGLPFVKDANEEKSFKLFELGVIDDEELLKNLDYPNYEMVLQRVNQKKQAMQQMQMQMQQHGLMLQTAGKQAVKATPQAAFIPPPLGGGNQPQGAA